MAPHGPPEPPAYRPYTKKGLPRKRPGPAPKPKHELAKWKNKKPLQRVERSYTRERKIEVLMFLLNHRIADTMPGRAPRRRLGQPPIAEEPTGRNEYGQLVWERAPTYAEASAWYKVPMPTIHGWWDNREKILQGTGVNLPEMPASLPVPEWLTKPLDKNGPQYYPQPPPTSQRNSTPKSRPPPPQPSVPVLVQSLPLIRAPPPPNQGPPPPPVPGTVPPLNLPATTWTVYPTPPGAKSPRPTEGQVIFAGPVAQHPTPADKHQNNGWQTAPAPGNRARSLPQAINPGATPSKAGAVQSQGDTTKPPPTSGSGGGIEATQIPGEGNTESSANGPSKGPTPAQEATESTSTSPRN